MEPTKSEALRTMNVHGGRKTIMANEDDLTRLTIKADANQKPDATNAVLSSVSSKATDESMRNHWTGGKFFIHPNVPVGEETPKSSRNFKILPLTKELPQDVLKRHGSACINVKGKKSEKDKTVGQDMFSVTYLGNGWWLDLVADGHGTVGDFVADRVSRTLPHFFNSTECSSLLMESPAKIDAAFELAFERTQKDVVDTLGPVFGNKLMFSGTTCICLLRQEGSQMLHVAWVGDSKAILMKPDGTVVYKTEDHKPENPVERDRITTMGCEIVECKHDDGVTLQKINVAGQNYPAISFTRSFGDQCVKELGVHAKPQVEHWDTAPGKGMFASLKEGSLEGGFVLLASDGVWEFIEEQEVGTFIGNKMKEGKSAEELLPDLVAFSQERWRENEDDYCDDITALLVTVKCPVAQPPVPDTSCSCFAGICSVM